MTSFYLQKFIASASDDILDLFNVHNETMLEIQEMAVYFGENRNYDNPEEIFKIFDDFVIKFEVHNIDVTLLFLRGIKFDAVIVINTCKVMTCALLAESTQAECHHKATRAFSHTSRPTRRRHAAGVQ